MIRVFLFMAFLAWPLVSSAGTKSVQPPAETFDEEKILRAMAPYVKAMDRPLMLFHWEKADSPYTKDFDFKSSEGTLKMVRKASESFLASNAKNGFYLATDPVVSRNYGGENWRLVRVTLPKGAKYLDIYSIYDEGSNFFRDLVAAFPGGQSCALNFVVSRTIPFKEGVCAAVKRNVFRRLGLAGLRYRWAEPGTEGLCAGEDKAAFVLTDASALSAEDVKSFTGSTRGASEERAAIQEVLLNERGHLLPNERFLWADLPKTASLSEKTKRWMRKNLVNC